MKGYNRMMMLRPKPGSSPQFNHKSLTCFVYRWGKRSPRQM